VCTQKRKSEGFAIVDPSSIKWIVPQDKWVPDVNNKFVWKRSKNNPVFPTVEKIGGIYYLWYEGYGEGQARSEPYGS